MDVGVEGIVGWVRVGYWEFCRRWHDPPVNSDKQLYKVDCGRTYKKPALGPQRAAPWEIEYVEGKFGCFVAGTMKSGVDQDCYDSDDEADEEEVKPCIKKAKQPSCRYSIPTSIVAAESWLEVTAKFGPSGH